MAGNSEPPYLPIGTDVSAKYRGAFCEAKVKKIIKSVKCRVFLKETQSILLVTDEFISGTLQVGATVEVKHPDTGRVMEAYIKQMSDSSMYTVVFDDADERTLRRTQLCLKGDKHFMESETLDNLPLSNPEHFGTPVIARGKRGRSSLGTNSNHEDSDLSSEEEDSPRKKYRGKNQELVGKVMFYECGDRKKSQTLPVLVVLPDAHATELKNKDHVLVRSFKDAKFLSVARKELLAFSRETVLKNEDKALKPAIEKALLYIDNRELPATWNKEEMLGSDDDDQEEEEDTSDDEEQNEERDRFVAQLYKFCDDRGTPINKGPSIGTKDLNLYKLFKVVQKIGGYNRVTNQMKWRLVYSKMLLPPSNTASTQIKNAYKKYLHAFEDFYRKLGSSMGTISRPSRSRNDSGRSILPFRGREAARTPDKTESDKEKMSEGTKSEIDSDAESVTRMGTPKRPKSARKKVDLKDIKEEMKIEKQEKNEKQDKQEVKKDDKKESKKEESPKKIVSKRNEEKKEKDVKQVEVIEKKGSKQVEVIEKKGSKQVEVIEKKGSKQVEMIEKKGSKQVEVIEKKGSKQVEVIEKKGSKQVEVIEKKGSRKKEDGSLKVKSDTEDELKDLQKKIGRRRSMKTEGKNEDDDEEQGKKEKKEEIKKEKDEEETEKKKEMDEKAERKFKKKKKIDDGDTDSEVSFSMDNIPIGAKLKVKYGKGKNTREYEAKIVEVRSEAGSAQYFVHYQGWNNRHDEWVGKERIMKVLERPDMAKRTVQKPSPKPGTKGPKKKSLLDKPPASPSSVKSDSSASQAPTRAMKYGKSPSSTTSSSPSQSSTSSAKPRPTRSNSIELIADSLPAKRRKRKVSSVYDSTNGSDSEDSVKSDVEDEKKPEKVMSETPVKSTSMPSIDSEKSEVDITDLNAASERSPPKLIKVEEIVKETMDIEERTVEKDEVKEEPDAPVLNVATTEKICEPILQKIEAQFNAEIPVKQEKSNENKEKEVKKKEPERRGRKPLLKSDKLSEPEVLKKAEKPTEESGVKNEEEKPDESPFDYKDEPTSENEVKTSRIKTDEHEADVEEKKELVKSEVVKATVTEVVKVLGESQDDSGKELAGLSLPRLVEDKDSAKSDSEVERRGRKRKVVGMKETVKDLKPAVAGFQIKNETQVAQTASPERKPFVTLAEKKQGFSPMVRKVIPPPVEKEEVEPCKSGVEEAYIENACNTDEVKKGPDMLVVHKVSPAKADIVLGKKVESDDQADGGNDNEIEDLKTKEDDGEAPSFKKKVRKKTKKKVDADEQEVTVIPRKGPKRGPGRKSKEVSNKDIKDSDSVSALKDENSIDIDLRCEEQIRSRSASPETLPGKSYIQESQGFVPRIETIDCRISDSQGSDSFSSKLDKMDKSHTMNKNNMFENTPPTTPEHDSDDMNQQHIHNDQIKAAGKSSDEGGSKTDTSQAAGSESPVGNASPSNHSTSSSGMVAGSEGSIDVPVYATKRRRESDEPTPSKRRKRASRGKSTCSRTRQQDSDSEDFSKGRSPHYSSESYSRSSSLANRSPRPPKYNFNLEEGKCLEGTDRISFLVDKIQEIRKIYMNLKTEVACIDRRRKKLRRKERERGTQNSSAVEVECS